VVANSHASTAPSYADGIARAFRLRGTPQRRVAELLCEVVAYRDGPPVVRFPKCSLGPDTPAIVAAVLQRSHPACGGAGNESPGSDGGGEDVRAGDLR
jgi:hypothetical protein